MEALPETDQQYDRIQNKPLDEKYGHMEVRTQLFWETLVEIGMDHNDPICAAADSVIP